jgi:lysozyme
MSTNPVIIDISHYQPQPDWKKVAAGGTIGVILKATENLTYVDPTYYGRQIGAIEAGVLVAAYHFLRPNNIDDQMRHFVKTVAPSPGERLVVDYEDAGIPFKDLERAVHYLLENTQCEITVYGSNVLVDACKGKKSPILEQTSLWQARYSSSQPAVPTNIWPTWTVWQYTDKAVVDGISGNVDGNKWNGDPARIPQWFDANAITPPAPEPEPEPVPPTPDARQVAMNLMIESPDDIDFTLTVNGRIVFQTLAHISDTSGGS